MRDIDIFLHKLDQLTIELEMLGKTYADLYKQYDGNDFENQNYLAADKLDNAVLTATHEMASTIGFMGADIKMITNFIDFRKAFKEFTDEELENMIDNPALTSTVKLSLAKKLTNGDTKLLLDRIQTIQQLWNKTFDNKKYQPVWHRFSAS